MGKNCLLEFKKIKTEVLNVTKSNCDESMFKSYTIQNILKTNNSLKIISILAADHGQLLSIKYRQLI